MRVYAAIQCGIGKEQCEDVVVIGNTTVCDDTAEITLSTGGVVCIADGVGGNEGGQVASSYVAEQLKSFADFSENIDETIIRNRLLEINYELIQKGIACGFPDMATTLTGLVCSEKHKYIVHIGNTRAYALQGQYLKQLTTDHTVYNRLLKMGMVDEAAQCKKNEITSCFGGKNAALADNLNVTPCQDFYIMLLTSDGVHEYISLDEIERLLTADASSGLEKCEVIIKAAKDAGSADDMSVVIIINRED